MSVHPDVLVIGAGVIGLTTAVTLAEAGYRVRIHTAEAHDQTTSAVAGALWGPWLVEPRERVLPWAETTLDVLRNLAATPHSGVRLASGIEISNASHGPPDWAHLLPDRRPLSPHELPPGYAHGHRYTAPLIDMPTYLAHLADRLARAGGTVEHHRIDSIEQVTRLADCVVNCSYSQCPRPGSDEGHAVRPGAWTRLSYHRLSYHRRSTSATSAGLVSGCSVESLGSIPAASPPCVL